MGVLIFLFCMLFIPLLVLQIMTFVIPWTEWHPFYHFDECEGTCYYLGEIFRDIFRACVIIGIILICIKIISGVLIIFSMKKNLNFYYKEKWIHISRCFVGFKNIAWHFIFHSACNRPVNSDNSMEKLVHLHWSDHKSWFKVRIKFSTLKSLIGITMQLEWGEKHLATCR